MIKSIGIDEWKGSTFNEEIVVNPTWADTLSLLIKLDGDKFTLVFCEISDTDSALVGGGPKCFIVSITIDGNIYTLMNDKQGENDISLVVGGQLGNYCDNICIDLNPMLEVMQCYFETGKLLETHQWKQE
ncbi:MULTISPECIES: hypothetical protein [unclassified Paenibacillus]|uniref:hypothetical protein n=1 Tax=unclassified Paenibacillus TaxID=185978 RepID=UPI000FE19409|nr:MULTISPECIES: hypothetical protein [unclassified Paenibacillus]MCM3172704.1 hypothetical protein [Paenibacillus sp. MER 99-2]